MVLYKRTQTKYFGNLKRCFFIVSVKGDLCYIPERVCVQAGSSFCFGKKYYGFLSITTKRRAGGSSAYSNVFRNYRTFGMA